jgi:choline monooxygenase
VQFDYWLESAFSASSDYIERSLAASDQVQAEDIEICENVQIGLGSGAYQPGRYAPKLEHGDHAFHRQLYLEYTSRGGEGSPR